MRFSITLTIVTFIILGASASPLNSALNAPELVDSGFSPSNHYGAPIAPWEQGAYPGWHSGGDPDSHPVFANVVGVTMAAKSAAKRAPSAPVNPVALYTLAFFNLTGATQAGDYITYELVDSVASCQAMCNAIMGCGFVNSYFDYNQMNGKSGSNQLTCSLYSKCHTIADATNTGSQPQSGGGFNYITNSDGYCKIISNPN